MKYFALFCVLIVCSNAASIPEEAQAKILKYDSKSDGFGNYKFSFETSNGIKRYETGTLANKGQPNEHLSIQGLYGFTDADGNYFEVQYTADENGYDINGPNTSTVGQAPPHVVATLLG